MTNEHSLVNISNVSHLKPFIGPIAVAAILILLYSLLPLGTAFEFGEDEGYELAKGFLCSKGFHLYSQIWSDQPPVFSLLLGWAFKTWGPSILVARVIAVCFGVIFFAAFYGVVYERSEPWCASIATFLLAASPAVFLFSASVMQEVPAIGIGLVSVWLLFKWCHNPKWALLIASAAIMGIALQIKLTAMMMVPAILIEILLVQPLNQKQKPLSRSRLLAAIWCASVLAVLGVTAFFYGKGSFQQTWQTQFGVHPAPGMRRPEDFAFPLHLLLDHSECTAAAIVGIFIVAIQRKRELVFPIVFLLTALLIHLVHRPWWLYYYLHIAVPMAWLAGVAITTAISAASKTLKHSSFLSLTWKGVALCVLIALVLVRAEGRLASGIKDMSHFPLIAGNPVVSKMKSYASRTHWVYCQEEIYSFQSQLPMPPELAVVSLKRFWSGQITTQNIIETCKKYQVEQILLSTTETGEDWKQFLITNYDLVYQNNDNQLYVSKQLKM